MKIISKNLAFLRKKSKLTQSEISEDLHIGRTTYANWESGRVIPPIDQFDKILKYFNITYEYFMSEDIRNFTPEKKNLSQIAKSLEGLKSKKKNYFIPLHAQAGYIDGWANNEMLDNLETINIPNVPPNKELRTFEVAGSSMIPLVFAGDLLVCTKVEREDPFHGDDIYVIVTKHNGIYAKHIELVKGREQLRLISSNKTEYPPTYIDLDDIMEIWQTRLKVTKHLTSVSFEEKDDDLIRRIHRLEQLFMDKNPRPDQF